MRVLGVWGGGGGWGEGSMFCLPDTSGWLSDGGGGKMLIPQLLVFSIPVS